MNPWTRSGGPGKLRGVYTHDLGFKITHCGHPTANYPYLIEVPGLPTMVVSAIGKGFPTVGAAKAAVALLVDHEGWLARPNDEGPFRIYSDEQAHDARCADVQLFGHRWVRPVAEYQIGGEAFAVYVGKKTDFLRKTA